ncbi:MAG: zinc ABC transporter substrate-binding protein [Clostridia bacterium]|nr:zinc ABC transporter substrate-binding protein [Clostridia bacterium]
MKNICYFFIFFMMLFTLIGCSQSQNKDTNKLNIVTSFYPIYIATSNIVDNVENVNLSNMTNIEVGCLHDYQLTTKDMNELERADIFIVNGGGMESFLDKAINTCPELNIIDSSEGIIQAHEQEEHAEEDDEHGHHHGENAHIWVSISMYIEQVKNIAESLGKIDSQNKEKYMANANNYINKLEELKEQMHSELGVLKNRNIVTFHEAFEFFAEEFGLNVVAVIEREPGTSPSAGELAKIIEDIKDTNATAIFVEPQYDAGIANVIANETNKPVYTLDPVVTGELSKDAYERIMKENLRILKEALK